MYRDYYCLYLCAAGWVSHSVLHHTSGFFDPFEVLALQGHLQKSYYLLSLCPDLVPALQATMTELYTYVSYYYVVDSRLCRSNPLYVYIRGVYIYVYGGIDICRNCYYHYLYHYICIWYEMRRERTRMCAWIHIYICACICVLIRVYMSAPRVGTSKSRCAKRRRALPFRGISAR